MAGMIDIGSVLKHLNDTYDANTNEVKVYGLRFLAKAKPGEQVTREVICRKNVKSPKQKHEVQERGKSNTNLKRFGLVRVQPEDRGHPIDIKTAMIYGFRDFKSSTWLNVFH